MAINFRNLVSVCLLAIAAFAELAAADDGLDLQAIGQWHVVVDEDASPVERYAAEEFQGHLRMAGGPELAIVASPRPSEPAITIRQADGAEADALGIEGFRIVVDREQISITGGGPRGTLYGVYTFLEDYFGVRFLTADHTHVPVLLPEHVVPYVDRIYQPQLRLRWNDVAENEMSPAFAARLRCNAFRPINNPDPSRSGAPDPKLGGVSGWILINHSFAVQLPTSRYGAEHPDYFSLVDGRRRATVASDAFESQPCLTNRDVLRIVTEAVKASVVAEPERENFSVSQNDNEAYCRCDRCAAVDAQHDSPMGSLLSFVNAVAAEVARENPRVKIGTLAYQYSRKAPKNLRPHPNVQVELATIECSLIQPINDPDSTLNRTFCFDFEEWAKLSDDIHIWTYNTNFDNYLLPLPNLRALDDNIRFFASRGVKGIYFEDAHSPVSGFADVRNYVTSRLLWDPSLDGDELINEFITLHYGPAAEPIRAYIDVLHNNADTKGVQQNCFGDAADYGIDAAMIQLGLNAVEQAVALAAEDDAVRQRVEKFSIAIECAALTDAWIWIEQHQDVQGNSMDASMVASARPHARRFFQLCDRYGATEWHPTLAIDRVRSQFKQAMGLSNEEEF